MQIWFFKQWRGKDASLTSRQGCLSYVEAGMPLLRAIFYKKKGKAYRMTRLYALPLTFYERASRIGLPPRESTIRTPSGDSIL